MILCSYYIFILISVLNYTCMYTSTFFLLILLKIQDCIKNALMSNDKLGGLVKDFSASDLENIAANAWRLNVSAGEEVIQQGSIKADSFYVVSSGDLEVIKDGEKAGRMGTRCDRFLAKKTRWQCLHRMLLGFWHQKWLIPRGQNGAFLFLSC